MVWLPDAATICVSVAVVICLKTVDPQICGVAARFPILLRASDPVTPDRAAPCETPAPTTLTLPLASDPGVLDTVCASAKDGVSAANKANMRITAPLL